MFNFLPEHKDKRCMIISICLFFIIGSIIGLVFMISYPCFGNRELPRVNEEGFKLLVNGFETISYRIQKKDTLSSILKRWCTPSMNISDFIETAKKFYPVRRLKPGTEIKIQINRKDGEVKRLEYPLDNDNLLVVNNTPQGLTVYKHEIEFETRLSLITGTIKTSFFEDAIQAGLSPRFIMEFADIFGWDIDFFVDVREGDSFRILLEDKYKDGKLAYTKRILAAEFKDEDREYYAFHFKDDNNIEGYYDLSGKSVRKQFLKSPLRYSRISSGFSYRRFHPILRIYRPHYGIDYAAPLGTPISTVCDGKVTFIGWYEGYGNCITIQHNSTYVSRYGHLSHFARGIRAGVRIKQGETIGFVGSTGLATGPHLDFRITENGSFVNPFKLKNINIQDVSPEYRGKFDVIKTEMLARMEGPAKRGIFLARNSPLF